MKKYLLVVWVIVFLGVNGYADDNPFALANKFTKIEGDEDSLLSTLQDIAEKNDPFEPEGGDEEPIGEEGEELFIDTPIEIKVQKTTKEAPIVEEILENSAEEDKRQEVKKKALEKAKKEAKLKKIAKEKAKREAEVLAKAERVAKEKQEVAEYKARKEQQAIEDEKKRVAEEKALAKKKAQEKAQKEAELLAQKAIEDAAEEEVEGPTSMADINVTRERLEAKEKADLEYLEAVRDVSQEDVY